MVNVDLSHFSLDDLINDSLTWWRGKCLSYADDSFHIGKARRVSLQRLDMFHIVARALRNVFLANSSSWSPF